MRGGRFATWRASVTLPLIKLLIGHPIADPWASFYDAVYDGDLHPPTSTQIVLQQPNGSSIVFQGNFTVIGNDVTGGTVSGFAVFAGATKVMKATGLSLSAASFFDALQKLPVDQNPFFDIFMNLSAKTVGSNLDDIADGTAVRDVILGRAGNDRLYGYDGNDVLKGGPGNDFLEGDNGFDKLKGGPGNDVFHFIIDPMQAPVGYDKMMDFKPGEDVIELGFFGPDSPPPGYLSPELFHKGTSAKTAEHLVIYDQKHGNIYLDLDGTGIKPQFLLATVADGTKLHADDFYIGGMYMVSDARAKQDIVQIGRTRGGTNIYRFRYRSGGPPRIGVIAQEIEKTTPGAVITRPGGLKMVNYSMVR
ncbi:MAG: tail fiber domain-containing protein [Bauldia sp.]|nr:tail fiber domain-containing protein [Bauldia sp.]